MVTQGRPGPPERRSGPPGKGTARNVSPGTALDAARVRQTRDSNPVAAKLWRLREHYGYFTRAELGEPAHRDPGEPWPSHDVLALGLAPHPRETCDRCQAAGT